MLGLNKTIDQLAMASSVQSCGHVLRREDGYLLRRAFRFVIEGQMKKEAEEHMEEVDLG